ncbi:MAG: hypothetical protein WBB98_17740 [Xanthobacteraceae bacterium]
MPEKQTKIESATVCRVSRRASLGVAETRWQDRAMLSLQLAAEIAGISVASLYRAAGEGRLILRRLEGRTVVETASLIELLDAAEIWTPSDRGKEARAKRSAKRG